MGIDFEKCPCCGKKAIVRKWYDDRSLVETDIKCECGYHFSDSYGKVEITYPDDTEVTNGNSK